METDCIFCKIAAGATSTKFVHETDSLVVFNDIKPAAPVHLLVVPKKHIRGVNDLTNEDRPILADMLFAAKHTAKAAGMAESGYKVFFNVERGGGQLVFHLHMHVVGGWR